MPIRPDPDQSYRWLLFTLEFFSRAEERRRAWRPTAWCLWGRRPWRRARTCCGWRSPPGPRPASAQPRGQKYTLRRGKEHRRCRSSLYFVDEAKKIEEGTRKVVFLLWILDEAKKIEEGTKDVVFVLCILEEAKNKSTRKVVFDFEF